MQLHPTVYLPGLCEEAVAFYHSAIGAEALFIRRIADSIDPAHVAPGTENKVLRAALRVGESLLYLSDGHQNTPPGHAGFSLSLRLPTAEQAGRLLERLSEGGKVLMPLRQTSWAGAMGVLIDRYGLRWTIEA